MLLSLFKNVLRIFKVLMLLFFLRILSLNKLKYKLKLSDSNEILPQVKEYSNNIKPLSSYSQLFPN